MNKAGNEVRVVGVERLGDAVHSSNRAVWLNKYRFDKVKILRDGEGRVVSEVPFSEYLWKVFVLGKTLWLNERLLFSLREALDPLLGDEGEEEVVVECEVVEGV